MKTAAILPVNVRIGDPVLRLGATLCKVRSNQKSFEQG